MGACLTRRGEKGTWSNPSKEKFVLGLQMAEVPGEDNLSWGEGAPFASKKVDGVEKEKRERRHASGNLGTPRNPGGEMGWLGGFARSTKGDTSQQGNEKSGCTGIPLKDGIPG